MGQYWKPQIALTIKIESPKNQTGYARVNHACQPLIEMSQTKQAAYCEETKKPSPRRSITDVSHTVHHVPTIDEFFSECRERPDEHQVDNQKLHVPDQRLKLG